AAPRAEAAGVPEPSRLPVRLVSSTPVPLERPRLGSPSGSMSETAVGTGRGPRRPPSQNAATEQPVAAAHPPLSAPVARLTEPPPENAGVGLPSEGSDPNAAPALGPDSDEPAGDGREVGFGVPDGVPDGTQRGALQALAIQMYRTRIIAWIQPRFKLRGSGLSPQRLAQLKARATVFIADGLRVDHYRLDPTGEPLFDQAAQRALDSLLGQALPPPPPNYPGAVQTAITVTFACTRDSCS